MKSIIYIPARSGSKRIINKNIKILNQKPLLYWTIDFALKFKNMPIIISTDNEKWAKQIIKQYKDKITISIRPANLSKDKSNIIDAIKFDLKKINNKNNNLKVLLFQPTSPFRNYYKINSILKKAINKKSFSLASFKIVLKNKNFFLNKKDKLIKSNSYLLANGNFYISSLNLLIKYNSFINEKTIPYISSTEYENLDIDYNDQLKSAEQIINKKRLPIHLLKFFTSNA